MAEKEAERSKKNAVVDHATSLGMSIETSLILMSCNCVAGIEGSVHHFNELIVFRICLNLGAPVK